MDEVTKMLDSIVIALMVYPVILGLVWAVKAAFFSAEQVAWRKAWRAAGSPAIQGGTGGFSSLIAFIVFIFGIIFFIHFCIWL